MNQLEIDWSAAPEWANWVAQDSTGTHYAFSHKPLQGACGWHPSYGSNVAIMGRTNAPHEWRESLTQRPQTVRIHQDNDGAGMLRAQIGHLLEDMTAEQLDALYAHVRRQLDAAKFDELNRHLDKPFGEVPREWQLKAFEAALDGNTVLYWAEDIEDERAGEWCPLAPLAGWSKAARYRIEPKQS